MTQANRPPRNPVRFSLESTKKLFAMFDNVAKEAAATADTKYNRGDDLSDLLNQYQDYTDQRLAIERKFNEDIATLQEQRKQAEKDGNTEQVEQIDRSITQATKDKGMELMNIQSMEAAAGSRQAVTQV